jgi:aspartate/methionine/tyrosine aminotransferase
MERMMSQFEQDVDYNLSESGVHPVQLAELIADEPNFIEQLLQTELNYPHVNGIPELRQNIANLYDGAGPENVLVTVGAAEANYISTRTLVSPGQEIVVLLPNYMQIWGIARNHAFDLKIAHLREESGWAPDLAELQEVVSSQTKLIAVCNPNNPTGRIMTDAEMNSIVSIAERVGAWILADEVYAGAERIENRHSRSFIGRYDKVIATGSMSKAYGLPGLRIGWLVAPAVTLDEVWARHEYTTISATMLANKLAAIALSPTVRPRLLERTQKYIRRGYPVLQQWMDSHKDIFSFHPPDAAAIAFVRYNLDINSSELVDRLRSQKSVLIVPGDHFGLDHFVRISFGLSEDYLVAALDRFHELITEIT